MLGLVVSLAWPAGASACTSAAHAGAANATRQVLVKRTLSRAIFFPLLLLQAGSRDLDAMPFGGEITLVRSGAFPPASVIVLRAVGRAGGSPAQPLIDIGDGLVTGDASLHHDRPDRATDAAWAQNSARLAATARPKPIIHPVAIRCLLLALSGFNEVAIWCHGRQINFNTNGGPE